MPNDLEMLRWAGHGVAMGNAHPALLEVADEVTASNARGRPGAGAGALVLSGHDTVVPTPGYPR